MMLCVRYAALRYVMLCYATLRYAFVRYVRAILAWSPRALLQGSRGPRICEGPDRMQRVSRCVRVGVLRVSS